MKITETLKGNQELTVVKGEISLNFNNKKVRRAIAIIVMVVIVAMVVTMIVPYIL